MKEHGMREDQPMFQHFMKCEQFKDEFYMFNLPSIFGYDEAIYMKQLFVNSIIQNCKVIDMNRNWSQLCFLEALYIKKAKSSNQCWFKSIKRIATF